MKFGKTVDKLLANKMILNLVFVITLLNLIGHLMIGNFQAVTYFILMGLLMTFFSKNMILILGVPLIIMNLYAMRYNIQYVEGFVEGMTDSTDKPTIDKVVDAHEQAKSNATASNATAINATASNASTSAISKLKSDKKTTDNFEVGRPKNKVLYSDTIEAAYDDLTNVLGSDNINNLTNDTRALIQQQHQLTEAMAGLGPLMNGIKPLMEQIGPMMSSMKSMTQK